MNSTQHSVSHETRLFKSTRLHGGFLKHVKFLCSEVTTLHGLKHSQVLIIPFIKAVFQ